MPFRVRVHGPSWPQDIRTFVRWLYNKVKPWFAFKALSARAFKLPKPSNKFMLDIHKRNMYNGKAIKRRKDTAPMAKITKKSIGLYFDITVGAIVVLLIEMAAFLYIRDNVADKDRAPLIAGFAVFCSTYIIGKLISRLVR